MHALIGSGYLISSLEIWLHSTTGALFLIYHQFVNVWLYCLKTAAKKILRRILRLNLKYCSFDVRFNFFDALQMSKTCLINKISIKDFLLNGIAQIIVRWKLYYRKYKIVIHWVQSKMDSNALAISWTNISSLYLVALAI